jgi:NDP-sugar pyrophosphorylase family protein
MQEGKVRQLPLLDESRRVAGLVTMRQLLDTDELPLSAAVMAGGLGARLRPLTEDIPKPMLPVGDEPLLETIVKQLREAGIQRVNLITNYKEEVIAQHFADGRDFGVDIRYVNEDKPLGTAGGLRLLEETNEPLLVMNGDIVTRVDFRAMLDFHTENEADMTVALRRYEFPVPYGVVETDGVVITGISEKPVLRHFVSAGIYLLNPGLRRFIPDGRSYDMPDLVNRLVSEGHRIVGFPVREYWLDIGRHEDYERAQKDARSGWIRQS